VINADPVALQNQLCCSTSAVPQCTYHHSNEAHKMINARAADDAVELGRSFGGAAEDEPLALVAPVLALVAAAALDRRDCDGVVSPSALEALPRSELAKLHNWRMLFTSEGKSGVFKTAVWFVRSKQSTHCGKTDWKVSVQEHLITLINAPGLKMTEEIFASAGAASAQVLMLG